VTGVPADDQESGSQGTDTRVASVVDLAGRSDAAVRLRELYREILVPSFRDEELNGYETIVRGLEAQPGDTDVAVAYSPSGEVLGGMVGEWDPASRVYLLSYLAVRPGLRGRGVGSTLMQHLLTWSHGREALVVLAEVDDPRVHAASPLFGDPQARLSFYGGFGARVIDLAYFQPRLVASSQRVHGMFLLALTVQDSALADGPVAALRGDVLGGFLERYFLRSEGVNGPATSDPDDELGRLLDKASMKAGVRLLPIERYREVNRIA
jgi:GNAT superfamily N-acetyltransferase